MLRIPKAKSQQTHNLSVLLHIRLLLRENLYSFIHETCFNLVLKYWYFLENNCNQTFRAPVLHTSAVTRGRCLGSHDYPLNLGNPLHKYIQIDSEFSS